MVRDQGEGGETRKWQWRARWKLSRQSRPGSVRREEGESRSEPDFRFKETERES